MNEQIYTRTGSPVSLVCRVDNGRGTPLVRIRFNDGDEMDVPYIRLVGPSDLYQRIEALEMVVDDGQ